MPYGVRWPLLQVSAGVSLGPEKVKVLTTFAVLAVSVSLGGSIRGIVAAPVLPKLGLSGAGLPSSVRCKILPSGWLGSCAGVKRWRSPDVRNRDLPSGAKASAAPNWPPRPRSPSRQITFRFSRLALAGVALSFSTSLALARATLEPVIPPIVPGSEYVR